MFILILIFYHYNILIYDILLTLFQMFLYLINLDIIFLVNYLLLIMHVHVQIFLIHFLYLVYVFNLLLIYILKNLLYKNYFLITIKFI